MIEPTETNFNNENSEMKKMSQEKNQEQNSEKSSHLMSQADQTQTSSDELQKQIEKLEEQVKEKESKYLYLYADFDNFKKRAVKERSDLIKFGWESVARDLLQVVDNLERALVHMPPDTDKTLAEGLNMVLTQFRASLQKQGLQTIESLKKDFDPNLHEAVGQEESDLPQGTIVKEHTRGYTLHGRLLRPARVIVSGGPSQTKSS